MALTKASEGDAVRQLLDALNVLPLDREAARHAAEVRRKLDRKGEAIGMGDSLIAGIALAHSSAPVHEEQGSL